MEIILENLKLPVSREDVSHEIKKSTDDVLEILDEMMERIDARFYENELRTGELQRDISAICAQLEDIKSATEISKDEKLILAYQITKLQRWAARAGRQLGLNFQQ